MAGFSAGSAAAGAAFLVAFGHADGDHQWYWLHRPGNFKRVEDNRYAGSIYIYRTLTYCGWKKSCITLDGRNPINNGINHLSTGAGFIPSTVSIHGIRYFYWTIISKVLVDVFLQRFVSFRRWGVPCFWFLILNACIFFKLILCLLRWQSGICKYIRPQYSIDIRYNSIVNPYINVNPGILAPAVFLGGTNLSCILMTIFGW